ncbi:RNA-directed RNA polymerase [ssRNA phage Esthiorhiza.2_40]|uniref:RNA-directed RNA polymerase n=2 Tax=Fiersviridae TaxID=2842319 RepID=A0A8S5L1G2_9VIRU|nr:RNA-directed RNA polymerase [ssRNA phage Esthiorhiza.2_40]QDH89250.1 MAG: RNA-dependent RNA polymerase [Leviviridae sp.]DAD51440.1 TPA_asm: RNA-directed RNA polymerase [ssRNA phage Esthiorhiza.2_40]
MKYTKGSSPISEIFFALCKSVDSPVSLGAWLRFLHNQKALAEFEIRAADYQEQSAFELDYCVVSFLSKYKELDTGLDLEQEALRRFTTSEDLCRESNSRIREARKNSSYGEIPDMSIISSVLWLAKRKIARLLGTWDSQKIENLYGWGPGATSDLKRRRAFVDRKLCELPISVTPKALPYIRRAIGGDLHWSSVILEVAVEDLMGPFCFLPSVFQLTTECVIDTVPKNAKTHRVIAKEPRANGFLQKGVGSYIRKRLKRVGIDLDDQTANQEGAKRAFEEQLATLDLKAASDSMPIELIYELLPVEWAEALNDLRSPQARLPDGSTITLQKFSSMGNGFTFELETLIFWAVASSVSSLFSSGAAVLVYGDDIICKQEIADKVIVLLAFCGFQVNKEKSFTSGVFYESCGKHFFKGSEVTPVYQKEPVTTEVSLLRCGNRIIRLAKRLGGPDQLRKELSAPWHAAWRMGKFTRQFQLPLGAEGDDGWILPAIYFSTRPQDINLGMSCRVFRLANPVRLPANEGALLAWTLRRGVCTESPYGGFVTSSPDTPTSGDPVLYPGRRWVMPSGEFALSF